MVTNAGEAGTATSQAQSMAGIAVDKAGQVSSQVSEQAADVASTAAEQARGVIDHAAGQARGLLEQAKGTVRQQGEAQAGQLTQALANLRDEAEALLDGRPADAPTLVDQGRNVTHQLDRTVQRLEDRGLEGVLYDLQRFARRRPAAFLVGSGALGFLVGRLVRASRESDDEIPAMPLRTSATGPIASSPTGSLEEDPTVAGPPPILTGTTAGPSTLGDPEE